MMVEITSVYVIKVTLEMASAVGLQWQMIASDVTVKHAVALENVDHPALVSCASVGQALLEMDLHVKMLMKGDLVLHALDKRVTIMLTAELCLVRQNVFAETDTLAVAYNARLKLVRDLATLNVDM